MYKPFSRGNAGFERTDWRKGRDFVVKIVSFANPISCQLNPALWNILKFTQSAGGGERLTEECRGKKRKIGGRETETSGNTFREGELEGRKWKLATIDIRLLQSINVWIGHGSLSLNPCISNGGKTMSLSLSYT